MHNYTSSFSIFVERRYNPSCCFLFKMGFLDVKFGLMCLQQKLNPRSPRIVAQELEVEIIHLETSYKSLGDMK